MTKEVEELYRRIERFVPGCEQEERDKAIMLAHLQASSCPLEREDEIAHFTASGWVVDPSREKVLMAYHKIYDSWSWTGGHADGESDLCAVALREAKEETGVEHIRPVIDEIFSLETIVVNGHEKRGRYVASHLHMNVTYLLEADSADPLRVKEDENKGVAWFSNEDALAACTEPWMIDRVYKKLIDRVKEKQERK